MKVYFCAGAYGDGTNRRFALVRPSGRALPYVTDEYRTALRLFRLCRHHSHLYAYNTGDKDCFLLSRSEFEVANVGAPEVQPLSSEQISEIDRVIAEGRLWMKEADDAGTDKG